MRRNRFWLCACLIGTGCFIFLWSFIGTASCRQTKACGKSLPQKTIYQSGARDNVLAHYPNPTMVMLSVLPYEDKSTILLRMERPVEEGLILQYISKDRGETWQEVDWKLGYTNLKQWSGSERLMSRTDHQVLYDCYYKCKNGFGLSTDGGKTWTHVNPSVQGGSAIYEIELIETGISSPSRLYVKIWVDETKGPRVGVSNDHGRHFELLSEGILEIVESRADPSKWYGKRGDERLVISNDSGKSWAIMEGSKEFWQPYYTNYHKRITRSWKQYPDDEEIVRSKNIMQIESDPTHPDWIYVLTFKGLYISRDAGKTFRLSSLAEGWIDSIDRIAVDPLDGRFIYAVVDLGKFYRSSDYGCSWELRKPPPLPQ